MRTHGARWSDGHLRDPAQRPHGRAATVNSAADDPAWSERDALLVRLADEPHDTCGVSDTLWSVLTERFSDDQLLEIVITAGWYRLLSHVINRCPHRAQAVGRAVPGPVSASHAFKPATEAHLD
jgi:hypothetical protein